MDPVAIWTAVPPTAPRERYVVRNTCRMYEDRECSRSYEYQCNKVSGTSTESLERQDNGGGHCLMMHTPGQGESGARVLREAVGGFGWNANQMKPGLN